MYIKELFAPLVILFNTTRYSYECIATAHRATGTRYESVTTQKKISVKV